MLPASPLIDPEPPHNSPAYLSTSCTLPFRYVHCWSNFSQFEILRIRWLTLPHCIKLVDERLFRLWNCEKSGRVCTHTHTGYLSTTKEEKKRRRRRRTKSVCTWILDWRSIIDLPFREGGKKVVEIKGISVTRPMESELPSWVTFVYCREKGL